MIKKGKADVSPGDLMIGTGDMMTDWDARANENAEKYIAFGWHDDERTFSWSGLNTARRILNDIWDITNHETILEIGCGTGRIMRFFSFIFNEVHGTDVSKEMIKKGHEELTHLPNIHFHHIDGSNLGDLKDGYFDVVTEFSVFQHIPKKEYIVNLLEDAYRVMKPDGIGKFQIITSNRVIDDQGTWHGARYSIPEILRLLRRIGFHIVNTEMLPPSFWIIVSKRPGVRLKKKPLEIPLWLYWKLRLDHFIARGRF